MVENAVVFSSIQQVFTCVTVYILLTNMKIYENNAATFPMNAVYISCTCWMIRRGKNVYAICVHRNVSVYL